MIRKHPKENLIFKPVAKVRVLGFNFKGVVYCLWADNNLELESVYANPVIKLFKTTYHGLRSFLAGLFSILYN